VAIMRQVTEHEREIKLINERLHILEQAVILLGKMSLMLFIMIVGSALIIALFHII
jgi:hypothetical protein